MSQRRRLGSVLAAAVLLVAALPGAGAPPGAPPEQAQRPRIGLVLSGGGARGGAHTGVLKVLHELRVPVDVIVGTSAGAIVGAAYASGMTVDEIEAEMRTLHTARLFHDVDRHDLPVRRKAEDAHNYIGPEVGLGAHGVGLPKGVVAGISLEAVLRRLTARQRVPEFDRLPVPFRAVATDLASAEMVVLDHGSLATAVRASMALPAIVTPVEIDGRLLVDGGVSRNLPVDVARAMGAQVVIAVDIGTPLMRRDELGSLLSVSEQMVRVLTNKNTQQSRQELGARDVLITPDLAGVTTADFDHLLRAAAAGEAAARAAAAELSRFRIDGGTYAAWERHRATAEAAPPGVEAVQVAGMQRANPAAVQAALDTQAGRPFDAAVADADMKRLYASGDFEHVSYHLDERPEGGHVFVVDVTEKSTGPHRLRLGLELSSDFDGGSYFNLLLSHRLGWINRLGAEWRNELQIGRVDRLHTEWHQPFERSQSLFASAQADLRREPLDLFLSGQRIGRYKRETGELRLGGGIALGKVGELRLNALRGQVRLATETGIIPGNLLVPTTDLAGIEARLRLDTLDSLRFPRRGALADVRVYQSLRRLGAADAYRKLQLSLQGAMSAGRHTLRAGAFATHPLGGSTLPSYETVQLGGFLRLSGYRTGQLLGTQARFGRLIYMYRLGAQGLLEGSYLGVSAELGRIDSADSTVGQGTLRSNALFFAADTPIGPVYLGWGHAPAGHSAFYFYLGMP